MKKCNYQALTQAIKNCAATFGAGSVKILLPSQPLLQQELIFPAASPDDLWADLATWRRCAELAKRTGPTPAAQPRIGWADTFTTKEEWHALIFAAQDALALAPSPSPEYGSAGRPSPGRLVRLQLTKGDVPATIHAVTDAATGACLLTYDDVPECLMDRPIDQLPMHEAINTVRRAIRVPFGHEPGHWDYWPKV